MEVISIERSTYEGLLTSFNSFVAKLRKVVNRKQFWKINAIQPEIKARRGRMKKYNLGQKANWGGLVKELGCQIVTQLKTFETR